MCTPSKQIKFCACLDKSIPFHILPYRWVLEKERETQSHTIGVIRMRKESPEEVLNRETYLEALNQDHAFDMDYNFQNGDQITLYHRTDIHKYETYEWSFTYVFIDGRWEHSAKGFFTEYDWIVRGKIDRK